ncbi:Gfo/Idh/MocA family oxidoreductase [Acrocarpospora macrocephala]|uniref:Oxidoreductase n=1 Tax=Acrocarpospora macrocephala TaxID=150177 RepID=A0A5M3X3P2_9ACTN|nr:Gfo/Idh/MocA family oxidoreductase [Acrocarpospora macrocephala]GES14261.1 oxidoreductase [Acrocarpospora macrocephala]
MTRLGVGVAGCGGAAVDLCHAIDELPGGRLAGAFDLVEHLAASLALPRGAAVHGSLASLLADPAVDIVYVAVPHHLLAPITRQALQANRHVLVEKPMALDLAELRALERAAAERDRRLGVVFPMRMTGPVRAARDLIAAGAIGQVRAVRIRTVIDKPDSYWESGPSGRVADGWRSRRAKAGGGVVLMNVLHQLDALRYLTGLEVIRASAEIATLTAKVEVEDNAGAVLKLSGGALATLAASAHSPGARAEERIEIDGSQGRIDLPDPYQGGQARVYLRQPWGDLSAGRWNTVDSPVLGGYVEVLRGFLQAVQAGLAPPIGPRDAAAALATVLAIYQSAETGQSADVIHAERDGHA